MKQRPSTTTIPIDYSAANLSGGNVAIRNLTLDGLSKPWFGNRFMRVKSKEGETMQKELSKKRKQGAHALSGRTIEAVFILEQPDAHDVFLCGDFNQWSPSSLRMVQRAEAGCWEKRLSLAPGRYEYKFVVDGVWMADPNGAEKVDNAFGSRNSVKEVSG